MKINKFTKIAGSVMLIASMGVTGCSVNDPKSASEDQTGETSATETTEAETESSVSEGTDGSDASEAALPGNDIVTYNGISYMTNFPGTHGEIEDQMDYMVVAPDPANINWDRFPEDGQIHSIDEIENEDIRALAQAYEAEGYWIADPALIEEFGTGTLGDSEYVFVNGFYASISDDEIQTLVYVFEMNEELFDHYLAEPFYTCYPNAVIEDNGDVIRVEYDENYVEFDRNTGIGTAFVLDKSEGVG